MNLIGRFAAAIGVGALLAGCASEARLPDLEAIYNQAAEAAEGNGNRRPLVAIPGTLGSRLVDTSSGNVIWGGGGSAGISADPEDPDEYQLIALPIARGDEPLTSLRDTVRAGGILETANAEVLGIPIDINVYGEALRNLAKGGFVVDRRPAGRDHRETGSDPIDLTDGTTPVAANANPESDFDTFQFDYDWRRDLIESAHEFGRFLDRRRALVGARREVPAETVRFDLLAHSMGSLVSRYFLMYGFAEPGEDGELPPITWAGADYFDRVVFVAPPNAGSVIALDNLINGKELGPLQPVYPAPLLASHPAPYQLMPRTRHNRVLIDGEAPQDLFDIALWERKGWGMAAPSIDDQLQLLMPNEPTPEGRRARAIAHQARLLRRAKVFHQMMDRWAPPPVHLDLFLVVGGGFETPAVAEVDSSNGAFRITQAEEGDGVVLRASALLDERLDGDVTTGFRSPLRFKTTLFLPDEHVELTRNPVFGDNLLFWLLEAPRRGNQLARPDKGGLLASVSEGNANAPTAVGSEFPAGTDR
jgi:hypothetical protein